MLKFPHARLLIHNLIAERKLSGEDALATAACELGLMSPLDIEEYSEQTSGPDEACKCSRTAKFVLQKHFEKKHLPADSTLFNRSWETIQHCHQKCITAKPLPTSAPIDKMGCTKHAPAMFDYLLQEMHRHND